MRQQEWVDQQPRIARERQPKHRHVHRQTRDQQPLGCPSLVAREVER
jgi:hypothetical protein